MHVKRLVNALVIFVLLTAEGAFGNSLQGFCNRAESGERLTVAFHGGSLTWGANATDPNRTSWRALIGRKLAERFPKAHFMFVDAAIGGTNSQLGIFRLDRDVLAYDPDLLFLEWCCNDGITDENDDQSCSYEGIVRRYLLSRPDGVLVQIIIPTRDTIVCADEQSLKRRSERLELGRKYNFASADLLGELRKRYRAGTIDIDVMWPMEIGDRTHPFDTGYAVFADVIWSQLFDHPSNAVAEVSPVPVCRWKYRHVVRKRIPDIVRIPDGWRKGYNAMRAGTFDFLCSRWQDGVTIATNNTPLVLSFQGEVLLLFGESTDKSGIAEIWVDGRKVDERDCGAFGRKFSPSAYLSWQVGSEFDGTMAHSLEIRPRLSVGQELRLESVCVAGEQGASVTEFFGKGSQGVGR